MMNDFISIDFETGNPKRVSACALGYAKVSNGKIIESKGYLIKPIGGHAPFQSKIHGIKEEHTFDQPDFGELFPEVKNVLNYPLVAHSLFDKQVLIALSNYFNLEFTFDYIDSCAVAKQKLPNLKNYKLKTLVKHFQLSAFKHHDAREDAIACANIYLKLHNNEIDEAIQNTSDELSEFESMVNGILADNEVNYKEAFELLYWLEDHEEVAKKYQNLYRKTKEVLGDDILDVIEAREIKVLLEKALQ